MLNVHCVLRSRFFSSINVRRSLPFVPKNPKFFSISFGEIGFGFILYFFIPTLFATLQLTINNYQ